MKNLNFKRICLFLGATLWCVFTALAQEKLEITPADPISLDPGKTHTAVAIYTDADNNISEVNIKWHTEPGYLGKADKDGVLTAGHPGEGYLIAKYKELRDSVKLTVTGTPKDGDDDEEMDDDYPKVKIVPGHIRVEIMDSVELRGFYIDTAGVKIDTTFMWMAQPESLGEFKDPMAGMFYTSDMPGSGIIIAKLGELADTAKLTIYETKGKKEKKEKEKQNNKGRQLTITPGDTIVYTGQTPIQYDAILKTNGNKHQGNDIDWSVSDTTVASIDDDGLLNLKGETGMTLVNAAYGNFRASVELLVVDSTVDLEINTISIHKVLPNGKELKPKTIKEGEAYKIGGLPYPLNILNGGMLHFPFGSIDEDIVLYMFIPEEYAELEEENNTVSFNSDIITGVKFSVKPVDSTEIVEPYNFNVPVILSMVFKHGLLDSLGITPEELDVFFAENTGFIEVDEHVAVDTVKNKIYANIVHFSTIVVKQNQATTSAAALTPLSEDKILAYPNPFNDELTIQFMLGDPGSVNITVYNLFGQFVKTLAESEYSEGLHQVKWQGNSRDGSPANSGIYFCRFVKDGKVSQIKKIILKR